jgi:formylglycine-generating enzyme required for sulfatase activity
MIRLIKQLSIACALASASIASAQVGCEGDISGDGRVDGVDLAVVLTTWGTCTNGATITGIYPPSASIAGGTSVAVVGVDLGSTASVLVDGVVATSFSVISPSVVTVVTPPAAIGPRALVLRNSLGQEIASSSINYFASSLPWAEVIEQCPDPAVVTKPELRSAMIATGLPWRVRDKSTQIEMLLIPPGSFQMGCSPSLVHPCAPEESPVHQVTLTRAFYIGRLEVTQAQWTNVMGWNSSIYSGPNHPVETVGWTGIQTFLAATGLRLPTEAEWEFASRAASTTAFHAMPSHPEGTNDDAAVGEIAWFGGNNGPFGTKPVGQKAANGFGLHDMSGNVRELLSDWYSPTYYSKSPTVDPQGPQSGSQRVLRGGSWATGYFELRSSHREGLDPNLWNDQIGFRVARNP